MASGATGDGMFHGVYGGSISSDDLGLQHRPYHRNCSCALHNSVGGHNCSHAAKVSYRVRRSWSEGSMVALKSPASHELRNEQKYVQIGVDTNEISCLKVGYAGTPTCVRKAVQISGFLGQNTNAAPKARLCG
nr:zinc finger, SWIM-type [Tanacetum cinerariifolium]